jgi:putative flippase GtrA
MPLLASPSGRTGAPGPRRTFRQLAAFFAASVAATGVDYGLYLTLARWIAPEPANMISYSSAMLVNFALQRWFVFRGTYQVLWLSFVVSMSLSGIGMLLSTAVIFLVRLGFPQAVLAPKLIATGVVFFWNFLSKKYLAFPIRA